MDTLWLLKPQWSTSPQLFDALPALREVLEQLLSTSLWLQRTDLGNLQLVDPQAGTLGEHQEAGSPALLVTT